MIYELPTSEIRVVKRFFPGKHLDMVISSIAEGNTDARLWVDQPTTARTALLWDKGNNVFYLGGQFCDLHFLENLSRFVRNEIMRCAIEENCPDFTVHECGKIFQGRGLKVFRDYNLRPRRTLFLQHHQLESVKKSKAIDNDLTIRPIDRSLLDACDLEHVPFVRREVEWMWPSIDRFYDNGFGFVAIAEGKVTSWCTAEYVSRQMCGVGIETMPDYQDRGIATVVARAFVNNCLNKGIVAYWECDVENLASVRVAEKVGFKMVEQSPSYAGRF